MNVTRSKPEATVIDVTPELAASLLKTSPGNRRLRGWYVSMLASAMKRGEWRVTSQGIGIDNLGRLRDAHHRLNAVVKSGVTVQSVMVMGLPLDAYQVIDCGVLRSYGDRLNTSEGCGRLLREATAIAVGNQKPTAFEIEPFRRGGLEDAYEALTQSCGSKAKYFSSVPIRLAAILRLISSASQAETDFILCQYRALCLLDYDSLIPIAKALSRQVAKDEIRAANTDDALARGLKVFDIERRNSSRLVISDGDVEAARAFARAVLQKLVNDDDAPEPDEEYIEREIARHESEQQSVADFAAQEVRP